MLRGKPGESLLSKKNMTTLPGFTNFHLKKLQDFWNNETKVEMFGRNAQQHIG